MVAICPWHKALTEEDTLKIMELYATGFNAWDQLQFNSAESEKEPDDISSFTCVLQDDHINCIHAFLSYTRGM
jgi:hypothetical protein